MDRLLYAIVQDVDVQYQDPNKLLLLLLLLWLGPATLAALLLHFQLDNYYHE